MNKGKIIDLCLVGAICVAVVVTGVLGVRLYKVKTAAPEVSTEPVQDVVPDTTPMYIGEIEEPAVPETIEVDPVLSSGDVLTYMDQYADVFGTDVKLVKESKTKSGFANVYSYESTDVCFKVLTSKDGLVTSIGDLYNKLGNYPLAYFSGDFPDKDIRKDIYATLKSHYVSGICTVFYQEGTNRITVIKDGYGVKYFEIGD